METSEGVKSVIDFIKERLSNKFFLPYIFFFSTYNWPILIYAFSDEKAGDKYKFISDYLANHWFIEAFIPGLSVIFFIFFGPLANLLIELYYGWADGLRQMEKIKNEKSLLKAKIELAEVRNDLRRAEESGRENEFLKKNDVEHFRKLDEIADENLITRFLKDVNFRSRISFSSYNKIKAFVENSMRPSGSFSNASVHARHEKFVEAISSVISGLFDVYERSGDMLEKRERTLGEDFLGENATKTLGLYNDYRSAVKEYLGV